METALKYYNTELKNAMDELSKIKDHLTIQVLKMKIVCYRSFIGYFKQVMAQNKLITTNQQLQQADVSGQCKHDGDENITYGNGHYFKCCADCGENI